MGVPMAKYMKSRRNMRTDSDKQAVKVTKFSGGNCGNT